MYSTEIFTEDNGPHMKKNSVEVFANEKFGEIRTAMINDEPWFVGKDVAEILGYQNPQDAIRNHVYIDDKVMGEPNATPYILDTLGRK